jgi:hypothetical protein
MERKPLLKVMPCVQTQTDSMVVERDWLHAVHRHGKLTGLEAEYQLAAGALQDDLSEAAYRRLQEIDREIKLVLGMEAGPPDQP